MKNNKKIRVVIVDKKVVVRRAIARILRKDPVFEILCTANHLAEIEELVAQKQPDAVLLEVGNNLDEELVTIASLKINHPQLPVMVLSPLTKDGALAVFEALKYGAIEYVTKPVTLNNILYAENHFQKRLISILKMIVNSGINGTQTEQEKDEEFVSSEDTIDIPVQPVEGIVMGGCTGAVRALYSIIPGFKKDFSIPIVIAQHMPKIYTEVFADQLDKRANIKVREAFSGAKLKPGTAWILPGGFQGIISRADGSLVLDIFRGPRENKCRPSIDVLFRSASEILGPSAIGLILSGGGVDGVSGARYMYGSGGKVLLQDENTSQIWELGKKIIQSGYTNQSYPVKRLPEVLEFMVSESQKLGKKDFKQRIGRSMRPGLHNSRLNLKPLI